MFMLSKWLIYHPDVPPFNERYFKIYNCLIQELKMYILTLKESSSSLSPWKSYKALAFLPLSAKGDILFMSAVETPKYRTY